MIKAPNRTMQHNKQFDLVIDPSPLDTSEFGAAAACSVHLLSAIEKGDKCLTRLLL